MNDLKDQKQQPTERGQVRVDTIVMRFKITDAEVHNWSTNFTITELNDDGADSGFNGSPEALIHTIGEAVNRELEGIEGLEFDIIIKA